MQQSGKVSCFNLSLLISPANSLLLQVINMSEEPGLTGLDVICWVRRGWRVVSEIYVTRHAATLLSRFSNASYYHIAYTRLKRTRNKYRKYWSACSVTGLKLSLWLTIWSVRGEAEIVFHAFLTSGQDGCENSPSCFYIVLHSFFRPVEPQNRYERHDKTKHPTLTGNRISYLLPVTCYFVEYYVTTLNWYLKSPRLDLNGIHQCRLWGPSSLLLLGTGAFSSGVTLQGCQADHWPLASAEVAPRHSWSG